MRYSILRGIAVLLISVFSGAAWAVAVIWLSALVLPERLFFNSLSLGLCFVVTLHITLFFVIKVPIWDEIRNEAENKTRPADTFISVPGVTLGYSSIWFTLWYVLSTVSTSS